MVALVEKEKRKDEGKSNKLEHSCNNFDIKSFFLFFLLAYFVALSTMSAKFYKKSIDQRSVLIGGSLKIICLLNTKTSDCNH